MKKLTFFIVSILITLASSNSFATMPYYNMGRMTDKTVSKLDTYRQFAQTAAEEIQVQITEKMVQGTGRYANLVLTGTHETYGDVAIYLNEYNGSYKTYDIYYASIGQFTLTGKGTWSTDGKAEFLDATLSTAQFGKQPTEDDQVFHIIATYTPQTTVTLNFDGFTKFGFDSQYRDWYMEIMGNDPNKPEYQYKVVLAYYAPSNNFQGTFTSARDEINMVDSYILTPAGNYVMFDSVLLTMEQKRVSANLQLTIASATLYGQDGVTYLVTCTHNSITPSQQYTSQINNATLLRLEDSFTFEGYNDSYQASFTINSNVLLGKHAMKAFDLKSTTFTHLGKNLDILSIQAEVSTQTIDNSLDRKSVV